MSSPLSSTGKDPSQKSIWDRSVPFLIPPVAASCAIIFPFRLFEEKAAQQLGEKSPILIVKDKLTGKVKVRSTIKEVKNTLKRGAKAAPTIGLIIGSQIIAQETIEYVLARTFNNKKEGKSDFFSMLVSSLVVGTATAPLLAAFNAQAAQKSAIEAIKKLTFKETGAITLREATFLLSFRINSYVEHGMKNIGGDNFIVDYFSAFTSGACGALIGHVPDTALTIWQSGGKISTGSHLKNDYLARMQHIGDQLKRGAFPRAMALGFFSVCYKLTKSNLSEVFLGNKQV